MVCIAPANYAAPRLILNPSFEFPDLDTCGATGTTFRFVNQDIVPGWQTTHPVRNNLNCGPASGQPIEVWESGFNSVPADDGEQFVELNAFVPSALFQTVCVNTGETINWQFSHRARSGTNTVEVRLGSQLLTTETSDTSQWFTYTGSAVYTGASGDQDFIFEAIGNGSVGNFLDNIQISLPPYVEFLELSSSDNEPDGGNIPLLRLNGELTSPASVDVIVTGGTASSVTDYNNVATVNIPAGSYDGTAATAIPINLTIVDDLDQENDETIIFGLANPTGGITITDSDCDTTLQDTTTYTIIDNDDNADLQVSKTDSMSEYTPGNNGTYIIIVTNNGPANVVGARLVDTLPGGLSLDGNWSCIAAANSSCISGAADGTGATGSGDVDQLVDISANETVTFTVPVIYSPDMSDY